MRKSTLITNYLSKCLELAIIVWGYIKEAPLHIILLLVALYHFGYLAGANIPFINWKKSFSGILILFGLGNLLYGFYSVNIFILCLGIVITASFIMQLKDNIKINNPISIKSKFISKILGMSMAIIMISKFYILLLIVFLAAPLFYVYFKFCFSSEKITTRGNKLQINFRSNLNWIQFFHHLHYFLFCYTFLALLKDIPPQDYSLLFILGWIAYYFMEKKYKREKKAFNIASIGYGHLFSGITVLLMPFLSINFAILLLWFITGFGGGTIYMLHHCKEKEQFSFFEDWGHVLGCLTAGAVIYLTDSVQFTLILSFISATIVALISFLSNRKIFS